MPQELFEVPWSFLKGSLEIIQRFLSARAGLRWDSSSEGERVEGSDCVRSPRSFLAQGLIFIEKLMNFIDFH